MRLRKRTTVAPSQAATQSPPYDWTVPAKLGELTVTADLNDGRVTATVQTSDDGFQTVRSQIQIVIRDGVNTYPLDSLEGEARAVRVRLDLVRGPEAASPVVDGFRITGEPPRLLPRSLRGLLAHPPIGEIDGVVPVLGQKQRRARRGLFDLARQLPAGRIRSAWSPRRRRMCLRWPLDRQRLVSPRRAGAGVDPAHVLDAYGLAAEPLTSFDSPSAKSGMSILHPREHQDLDSLEPRVKM